MCCARKNDIFNELKETVQNEYVGKIEASCYTFACKKAVDMGIQQNWDNYMFRAFYNALAYKVQSNMHPYLIGKLISSEIDIDCVADMTSHKLCPEKTIALHNEIKERQKQHVVKKYSSQHECSKCGGRKTTEIEYQSRCLDEASSIMVTCEMEHCSNKWRIS